VSCTLCHQIGADRLGTEDSFTGGYVVNALPADGVGRMLGPFAVDVGRTALMRSATGVEPGTGVHVQQSELCATCHTLFTHALDAQGAAAGELPEQVPYLEWRHSAFREAQSCQSCHMPSTAAPTPMASVLGEPRERLGRHTFLGGNFFMLRMLNRYRHELGVQASPVELDAAAEATIRQLQTVTASVTAAVTSVDQDRVHFDVAVSNMTGHKLPTGYPSRRAWLHVVVRDRTGRIVFESGRLNPDGSIAGNDNDAAPDRYEPHYEEIRNADEVQVYESMMVDARGAVTTGLLFGTAFAKDNRLLPRGFDKAKAPPAIAVHGRAFADENFTGGGDVVRYAIDIARAERPLTIDVALRFQPISFRWAGNLRAYDAVETRRFVSYYDSMAMDSATTIARVSVSSN
jgi:hypothetical protein